MRDIFIGRTSKARTGCFHESKIIVLAKNVAKIAPLGICLVLEHEDLHIVLWNEISRKACNQLDNPGIAAIINSIRMIDEGRSNAESISFQEQYLYSALRIILRD